MKNRYLSYGYDEYGQGGEALYQYNGMGQRTGKTENGKEEQYLLDLTRPCHNLLGLTSETKEQTFYWDGNAAALEEEGKLHCYLQDELGSPLRVSGYGDWSEERYLSYGYDEFGNDLYEETYADLEEAGIPSPYSRQGEEQPFGYTGYRMDRISGTYFAQAREYRPQDGRFGAEDIQKGFLQVPLSLNNYIYCLDSPISYLDFMGDIPEWVLTVLEQGDDAHRTLQYYMLKDGPPGLIREYPIPQGLEKSAKLGYYTPTGRGRADFGYVRGNVIELYEIKHDSAYGRTRGPVQLGAYVKALQSVEDAKESGVTVREGRVLLEYFNMRAYPSLRYKDRLIYYYTDPLQPGMIYWTYSAPPKLSLPVPVTKPVWEEVWEKAKQAGKAIEAIGMLAIAVALFADDAVGVVADDVVAVSIVLEALSLLRQAFSGSCDA